MRRKQRKKVRTREKWETRRIKIEGIKDRLKAEMRLTDESLAQYHDKANK